MNMVALGDDLEMSILSNGGRFSFFGNLLGVASGKIACAAESFEKIASQFTTWMRLSRQRLNAVMFLGKFQMVLIRFFLLPEIFSWKRWIG